MWKIGKQKANMEYLNINQIVERYPFTKGQVRHFLQNRHKNELGPAVRKIGKRLYIRSDLFEKWIESHKEN